MTRLALLAPLGGLEGDWRRRCGAGALDRAASRLALSPQPVPVRAACVAAGVRMVF